MDEIESCMSNTFFEFKKFTIQQDKCSMKVGTDGVILGAWVNCEDAESILDVGTGTGLIALMLAQKSSAAIKAIDIDKDAVLQAKENVFNSPFRNYIEVLQYSFQEFCKKSSSKFDLVVTNPPYFHQSYKSINEGRSLARHADSLTNNELIEGVKIILQPKGFFYLILPKTEAEQFIRLANKSNLYLQQLLRVKSRIDKDVEKRFVMKFGLKEVKTKEEVLIIEEDKRHQYTPQYKELTKDYYLNF